MTVNNEPFWSAPLFSAGLMIGVGMGVACSMIAVQLPGDFIGRAGQILFIAGVVTFVSGVLRLSYIAL